MEFIGYHGTSLQNGEIIVSDGFRASVENGWFGPGIYFFEDLPALGFFGRIEAKGWAIAVKKFENWCVIKAVIITDKVVDLLDEKQRKVYAAIRQKLFEKHQVAGLDLKSFDEFTIYAAMSEQKGAEIIRGLVNADAMTKSYWTYSIRRPQVQLCVTAPDVITNYKIDWSGML